MESLEKMKNFVLKNVVSIASISFAIIVLAFSVLYVYFHKCKECPICESSVSLEEKFTNKDVENEIETFKVDVKGAVKNPGVYEVVENFTVSDAINMAGGTNKDGVTTNINLAKKLAPEMVIYVFTKSELKERESKNEVVCEIPKCECEEIVVANEIETTNQTSINSNSSNSQSNSSSIDSNGLISINTDSVEELMRLDGIGESKAKSIIEYRHEHGNFKSIDEIMNVSGIGEKAFEKIKDKIKI